MRATSISLYWPRYDETDPNANYCGSYHVPCPNGDPRVTDLEAVNCGRFLDENGVSCRAFFFADEIEDVLDRAARETGCEAVLDECWPHWSAVVA